MQSKTLLPMNDPSFTKYVNVEYVLHKKKIQMILKRLFDVLVSIFGLILFSPIFFISAIIIKLDSKGPVFFKQKRVGRGEKEFEIYKFRSMVHNCGENGLKLTIGDDARITRSGKFIRKYKIDELPQLINVVKGEMSFVGPRPEVAKYAACYSSYQRQVFLVRPGITDYASIRFKNESVILGASKNPEETYIKEILPMKIDLKLKYIKEMSVLNDIKLILLTVKEVIRI
jgi:lipopolysaccharide/colanic/teichoic acid biosynthesis glycosyltransferase